jgi:hypothetical protein
MPAKLLADKGTSEDLFLLEVMSQSIQKDNYQKSQ